MAADQKSHGVSVAQKKASPSPAPNSATNKSSLIVMPQAAAPIAKALFPCNAAPAVASTSLQSSLCRMQEGNKGTWSHNSVMCGSAAKTGTELYSTCQIPCTSDGSDLSSSTQQIYDGCCSSSKRTGNCTVLPLQIPVITMDNELGSILALQGTRQFSSMKLTQALEPASKRSRAACTEEAPQKVKKYLEEGAAASEVDQGEEEEGCTTPTARDHRIPQYGSEVSALVCPPAPMKKACASKRRRLFYSANDVADAVGAAGRTADNFNSHIVSERRAFFVDPPDLHNFPDCIRALFK